MATLYLINFPEFLESKEFLKIGRSEVCVWGGGSNGQTIKSSLSVQYNIGVHFKSIKIRIHKKKHYEDQNWYWKIWLKWNFTRECVLQKLNFTITVHRFTFLKLWVFICRVCEGRINYFKSRHFISKWILLCLSKFPFTLNVFSQMSHLNGFSPVWILPCTFRWLFCEKIFPKYSHLNGFSLVLFLWWTFIRSFCKKVLSQKSLIKCLHVTSLNNSFLWECWNSKSWSSVSSISECDNDLSRSCSCLQDFDFLLNFSILHSSLESQL